MFKKATRQKIRVKMAVLGPSGSGKTYSALSIASGLGGKIAMIDTENRSGELYADSFDYDVATISPPFEPKKYIDIIRGAESAGYNVLIIDSLSHAWSGQGGMLDMHDSATKASRAQNSFSAWREVTPWHNKLIDAVMQCDMHVIMTLRTKTSYEIQEVNGKKSPVKVGLEPVFKQGIEYESTICFDLSIEGHVASASKDRTGLFDGQHFVPSAETGKKIAAWLEGGVDPDIANRSEFENHEKEIRSKTSSVDITDYLTQNKDNIASLGDKWVQKLRAVARECLDKYPAEKKVA